MAKISAQVIIDATAVLFAKTGMEEFSIRKVARQIPISPSVIYYYFVSEEELLKAMFDHLNHSLGVKRKALVLPESAVEMLKQRIEFQIDNQQAIVAVLKYYLSYRADFPKFKNGFVPDKSALHIEEVLAYGMKTGEFQVDNLEDEAKVITHAINGFLLEYFPYIPVGQEKVALIERINRFLLKALT